jgi:hypothetical protein
VKIKVKLREKLKPIELIENIYNMPLHNWEQMAIHGLPLWMIKNKKDRKYLGTINDERLTENFFNLHDQESALSKEGSEIMEKWRELVLAQMAASVLVSEGDRAQINFVNMYQKMIDRLMEGTGDVDIIKSRMIVQKAWGQNIDPFNVTVPEYKKIIEVVQEDTSRQNELNNRANG